LGTSSRGFTRTDSGADHAIADVIDAALNKNAFPTRQHMPANPVQFTPSFVA
jgi:hypothetical protein